MRDNSPSSGMPMEQQFGVFRVTQLTSGTALEGTVAVDLVRIDRHRTSETHRHREAETVIYVLAGEGFIQLNSNSRRVRAGDRLTIAKDVWHSVQTSEQSLTLLSVQCPPIYDGAHGLLDLEPLRPGDSATRQ